MQHRIFVTLSLVAGGAAVGACAHANFEPTDSSSRQVTGERSAAFYDVEIDGKNWGDVKVWSPGAFGNDGRAPAGHDNVVQVNVRLRNDGPEPATFDLKHTDLEINTEKDTLQVVAEPLSVEGDLVVEPGGISRISLLYPLPPGLNPRGVAGFELNWAVEAPAGRYTQSTPFRRERLSEGGYSWGYYYPYSYWGYGYPYGPAWPRYY